MSLQGDIALENSGLYDIPYYKELIKLQKEYVDFLNEECYKLSNLATDKSYEVFMEIFEKGIKFRDKIREVEEQLR